MSRDVGPWPVTIARAHTAVVNQRVRSRLTFRHRHVEAGEIPGGSGGASTTVEQPHPSSPTRRWLLVGAGAVVWFVVYQLNLRWWNWLLFTAAGLDRRTRVAGSVHFFFYDLTKIVLLLAGVIFVVTVVRSFMSVERTRSLLGGNEKGPEMYSPRVSASSRRSARAPRSRRSSGSSPPASPSASHSAS